MKMSDGERLIIVMLAEVMEALKVNKEIDPTLVKSLVIDNAGWALKRKYPGIFNSEPTSDKVVSETTNILWMWGIIESSISKLSGAEAKEASGWHWAKFEGFDGNNDDHHGIAYTMVNELGEFESFKGRALNSHTQSSLPHYREMYEKFDRYIKDGKAAPLSFNALRELCS